VRYQLSMAEKGQPCCFPQIIILKATIDMD